MVTLCNSSFHILKRIRRRRQPPKYQKRQNLLFEIYPLKLLQKNCANYLGTINRKTGKKTQTADFYYNAAPMVNLNRCGYRKNLRADIVVLPFWIS